MGNGQLAFGRFWWRDLSFQEARGGRTNRSFHFETRLFHALPLVCLDGNVDDWKDDQGNIIDWSILVSPLPKDDILQCGERTSYIFSFSVTTEEFSCIPSTSSALGSFEFTNDFLTDLTMTPFE